jgi:hypothetical protein
MVSVPEFILLIPGGLHQRVTSEDDREEGDPGGFVVTHRH